MIGNVVNWLRNLVFQPFASRTVATLLTGLFSYLAARFGFAADTAQQAAQGAQDAIQAVTADGTFTMADGIVVVTTVLAIVFRSNPQWQPGANQGK